MRVQLRVFQIERGRVRQFANEWEASVLPLRRAFGFRIRAAYVSEERDLFTWLLEHDGDFEAADAEYYASAKRAALEPDPGRLVESVVLTTFVDPVPV
jgi:hypothetical protein